MPLQRLFGRIPLEEMEHTPIVPVSRQTVIHHALFRRSQFGRFGVDGFDLVRVFGYRVDLGEYEC